MNRIILLNLFILALLTNAMGQESVNNFHAESSDLIWQEVFDTPLSFEEIYSKVNESGLLANIQKCDNKLTGELKQIDADFKGAGYSSMSIPLYIRRNCYTGFVIIELKEGKYRVTIKKIVLTQKYDDPFAKQGEKISIEAYAFKRGTSEIISSFMKSPSVILDFTFKQKFEFKQTVKNDNW